MHLVRVENTKFTVAIAKLPVGTIVLTSSWGLAMKTEAFDALTGRASWCRLSTGQMLSLDPGAQYEVVNPGAIVTIKV